MPWFAKIVSVKEASIVRFLPPSLRVLLLPHGRRRERCTLQHGTAGFSGLSQMAMTLFIWKQQRIEGLLHCGYSWLHLVTRTRIDPGHMHACTRGLFVHFKRGNYDYEAVECDAVRI